MSRRDENKEDFNTFGALVLICVLIIAFMHNTHRWDYIYIPIIFLIIGLCKCIATIGKIRDEDVQE